MKNIVFIPKIRQNANFMLSAFAPIACLKDCNRACYSSLLNKLRAKKQSRLLSRILKYLGYIYLLCLTSFALANDAYEEGKKQSEVCVACHGLRGISQNPQWPSIAGQHVRYLQDQLQSFKTGGKRQDPLMSPMVKNLTDEDMRNLAVYFAKQPLPKGATPKQYVARGEQLYRGGDFKKHITACIACHGPRGLGNAQAGFPVLSGQQPLYTIKTLQDFKQGLRRTDLNNIMQDISARMSDEDMEAVAYYVYGLH